MPSRATEIASRSSTQRRVRVDDPRAVCAALVALRAYIRGQERRPHQEPRRWSLGVIRCGAWALLHVYCEGYRREYVARGSDVHWEPLALEPDEHAAILSALPASRQPVEDRGEPKNYYEPRLRERLGEGFAMLAGWPSRASRREEI